MKRIKLRLYRTKKKIIVNEEILKMKKVYLNLKKNYEFKIFNRFLFFDMLVLMTTN